MRSPAVFLDRDGTIIENRPYLSDPDGVRILPGAAESIRQFADAGYLVVLVSNQSGVARGLFTEDQLSKVHARVESLLGNEGVSLDASYYCPYLDGPEAKVDAYRQDSELRKPRPGMLLQAAEELNIDLSRSWMIGDSAGDVEAGARAGCLTVLVNPPHGGAELNGFRPSIVVSSLKEAAARILRESGETLVGEKTSVSMADRSLRMLERMSGELERMTRPRKQRDFSVLLLVATFLQVLAVMAGLWAAAAMFDGAKESTTARFAMACFLQVSAIGAWVVDRFR